MPNIAFIPLYSQYENMGDTLLARELVRLVAPHVDKVRFAVDGVPAYFLENITAGLPSQKIGRYQKKAEFLRALLARKSDDRYFFFFLPGARRGEISWKALAQSFIRSLPFLVLARLLGGHICQVGISYDNLGPRHRFLVRLQALLLRRHIVRDVQSKQRLDAHGIRNNGVCPDFCFHVFPGDTAVSSTPPGNICFSFRTDQYPGQEDDCLELMCAVQAHYPAAGYHMFSQVERDRGSAVRLATRFTARTGAQIGNEAETEDLGRALDYYRGKDLVLSNRLHSLLFAASIGAAPLAGPLVPDNAKIHGIWAMLGFQEGLLDREHLGDARALASWLAAARPVVQTGATLGQELEEIFSEIFE